MSTSLLYQVFGIRGYRYCHTRYEGGATIFRIELPRKEFRCPECGHKHVHVVERFRRQWKAEPIGGRPVWIEMFVPKVECQSCGVRRRVPVSFADPRRKHTKHFEDYVMDLLQFMTPSDVSAFLEISWDTANDIQKRRLDRKYGRPKLRKLKRIAIDEIWLGALHKYITLVLDLDTRAVVFVGDGKGADALKPFWAKVKAARAKIRSVATDMSTAYISAVRNNLPNARLVFDRFHVVKLINEKLTELRRQLFREATDMLQKKVLKGTRWLLMMNPENLDDGKNDRQRLEEALELNKSLAIAYYLKEDLRQLWNQGSRRAAGKFLTAWCRRADASGIRIMQQLAKTMRRHRSGLLDWYSDPISTGPLEGINNKIKLMQRRAYGYRDLNFLKLRILSLHHTRYELVG
jgi:transposase